MVEDRGVDSGVGGQLKGISLDSFLQMMQMDRTSCTLQVTHGDRVGWLFVLDGELIGAELGNLPPFEAACRIVAWRDPVIEINNQCLLNRNEIRQPLMHVLMEGMRLRDEEAKAFPPPEPQAGMMAPAAAPEAAPAAAPVPTAEKDVLAERKNRRRRWLIAAAAAVAVLVVAGAGLMGLSAYRARQAHRAMLAAVSDAGAAQTRLHIIDGYLIDDALKDDYRKEAETLRDRTAMQWREESFAETDAEAKADAARGRLDLAVEGYRSFLKQFADGPTADVAKARIAELRGTMAEEAFRRLTEQAGAAGPMAAEAYAGFVRDFPESPHAEAARQRMADLRDAYVAALNERIDACRRQQDWDCCMDFASRYATFYGEDRHGGDFKLLQDFFARKIKDRQVVENLVATAAKAGSDLDAARKVFTDFLKTVPEASLKEKVLEQVARIDSEIAAVKAREQGRRVVAALETLGDRFVVDGDGTFTDRRSGLTWCLLDSLEFGAGCMNYDAARKHVAGLTVGGHRDWRLPTVAELAGLYKTAPFFPAGQADWYWSAETYTRYVGLKKVVEVRIVTSRPETDWQAQNRDAQQCGVVRAVRR